MAVERRLAYDFFCDIIAGNGEGWLTLDHADTQAEADGAAVAAGWRIVRSGGHTYHFCPDCANNREDWTRSPARLIWRPESEHRPLSDATLMRRMHRVDALRAEPHFADRRRKRRA